MSCFNFVILHYSPIQWFSQSMTTVILKLKINSYFTLNIFHAVRTSNMAQYLKQVYLRLPFKAVHSTILRRQLPQLALLSSLVMLELQEYSTDSM